jgi:hypothetical protein
MNILQCKTSSTVRKEIYVYFLAYKLLRSFVWSAAQGLAEGQEKKGF